MDFALVGAVGGVDVRVVVQREGARLRDEVVEGDFRAALLLRQLVEVFAHLDRALHVDVDRQVVVRGRVLALREAPGDGLPHLRDAFGLVRGLLVRHRVGRRLRDGRLGLGRRLRFAGRFRLRGRLRLGHSLPLLNVGLHVPTHDASLGPRPIDLRQLHVVLLRDAAGQGRRLDASSLRVGLGGHRLRRPLGQLPVAARFRGRFGFYLRLRRGLSRRLLSVGVRVGLGLRGRGPVPAGVAHEIGNVFPGLSNHGDQLPDGHGVALPDHLFEQHPLVEGLQVHRGLVRFHLGQHVARRHLLALVHEPSGEHPLLHGVAQLGHFDWNRHGSVSSFEV